MSGADVDTDDSVREYRGIRALAVGLLLAPAVFALHLLLMYMDVRHACRQGSALRIHLQTALALGLTLVGATVAYRSWKAAGLRWPDDRGDRDARSRFIAAIGLLLSLGLALEIIATWLPAFFLDPCQ